MRLISFRMCFLREREQHRRVSTLISLWDSREEDSPRSFLQTRHTCQSRACTQERDDPRTDSLDERSSIYREGLGRGRDERRSNKVSRDAERLLRKR